MLVANLVSGKSAGVFFNYGSVDSSRFKYIQVYLLLRILVTTMLQTPRRKERESVLTRENGRYCACAACMLSTWQLHVTVCQTVVYKLSVSCFCQLKKITLKNVV